MLRVFKYVKAHMKLVVIGTICMLGVIGIDQITPILQMLLVDQVIGEKQLDLFPKIMLAMAIMTILKSIMGFFKEYTYDDLSVRVHKTLKEELFSHMARFEFTYFDNMNTGELMSRINEDLETIWQTIGFALRLFIENIFYFVFSTIILFILDWRLTLCCLVLLVPIGFITVNLEKAYDKIYGKLSDQKAIINTTAQEDIAGIRLVKAFARENYEVSRFLKLNHKYRDINLELAHTTAHYNPLIELFANLSSVAMVIGGGLLILGDHLSIGTLVAFSSYISNLIWPMRQLGWLSNLLSSNAASSKKVFAILDRDPVVSSKEKAYAPEKCEGEITFNHVSFRYNDEVVLKDINLTIPTGSKVAIMGPTGSGKSSLISLIGRYYDVYEGDVLVDGVNVKDYDLHTLRKNMSLVFQDTFLFSDTIKDNIAFSKPNASLDEIRSVCKDACILPFIESLPAQFDTEIGERGLGLSGGQKQRLAIARSLLRRAPILILDDATSALDMETEHELLHTLNESPTPCTRLMIAHRISAVKDADLIIYLEDGQIKEQGTHETLLAQKGAYYDIFTKQYQDFYNENKGGMSLEKTS